MRRKKRPVRRLKTNAGLRSNAEKRMERYKSGLIEGYKQGVQAGIESYDAHFEGTSIIIPSHNEVDSVKACIEGIMDQTDLPYEVIVVDNGSTDGIEHYLKQLDGQVRYRILPASSGYTGAANVGFMMAKGTTILLLDNRIRATENWLDNLLVCLNSDSSIGIVGPVSAGLTGKQHMALHVDDMEDMQEFARMNNKSNSSKWHQVERLSSSCLLFRRELLERVGYLDEGCTEAPFDAADYGYRARLQGYSLVCARDAYIHMQPNSNETDEHFSNERERLAPMDIYESASTYFMNKWSGLDESFFERDAFAPSRQALMTDEEISQAKKLGEALFYPQQLVVKGLGATSYWIDGSTRRPIEGQYDRMTIRLSQLDLWRWSVGEKIDAEKVYAYMEMLHDAGNERLYNKKVCECGDGSSYYIENGKKRMILSRLAAEGWGLQHDLHCMIPKEELEAIPEGLPIIAPITLRQAL
ncbi:GT2 family glycosyltransferase [Paenibacillus endophyticus]|uniref:GT2 family glycosyltransferase n=1 Tax=Paenibacillus endophyticus TaxID=1294268 RepID=A0A7W5CD69_9BACL|nr:glycosyltransferase [Paenibacillus endophyticus]MBB3154979.1 GT2 family glycosyltransferase [Paenibacillus endophyticus]